MAILLRFSIGTAIALCYNTVAGDASGYGRITDERAGGIASTAT